MVYRVFALALAAFITLSFPNTAGADFVSVDCDGMPADFGSLKDALDSLFPTQNHVITVSGTCNEGDITIRDFENVTVEGSPGAEIVHPGGPFPGSGERPIIDIGNSRGITFRGLTLTGDPNGVDTVRIFDSQNINLEECIVENSSTGVFIRGASSVTIRDGVIQDNNQGVRIEGAANLDLMGAPFSSGTSIVQRNNSAGIVVQGAHFMLLGETVLQDNGLGIHVQGGRLASFCDSAAGGCTVSNNNLGILAEEGSVIDISGPARFEDNTSFGIFMVGASAARLRNDITFTGNGFPDETIEDNLIQSSAISVVGSSQLRLRATVEIGDNPGYGVALFDNSSLRLDNTVITNNGADGVRADRLSTVRILSNVMMHTNGGADLRCTNKSLASGDKSSVAKLKCKNFVKIP